MEVHFTPSVQAKLDQLARESGRPSEELLEDALMGYFDELTRTREMLDSRYRRFGERPLPERLGKLRVVEDSHLLGVEIRGIPSA